MTPLDFYTQQCKKNAIKYDPLQVEVITALTEIYHSLIIEAKHRQNPLYYFRKNHLINGLYVWGGIGIGKTFLMDCFFQCLPFTQKLRMHFHQFMHLIHDELTKHQGIADPLKIIAKEISQHTYVLCFDEFFVNDIADAMLLARLLEALFAQGVCLVTTSNVQPDDLYKNGLQRESFLPAIELLKKFTKVINLPSQNDYRLHHLKNEGVYYSAKDNDATQKMAASFKILSNEAPLSTSPIEIYGRKIVVIQEAGNVIWFEFKNLCSPPRSKEDFLIIAQRYHTVFISNIPYVPSQSKNTICLFIYLIDVFYNAKTRIIFSSDYPINENYISANQAIEFERAHSRLLEMQSEAYFFKDEA